MSWVRQHAAWLLFIGLVALLVANAWLFFPRYILNQQKLTVADLRSEIATLQMVATDGSALTNNIANRTAGARPADQLAEVQQRADDVVVTLQHAPYEVSLGDRVQESLELAQIVSFTLHDAGFNLDDTLRMSRTSQVLAKAATSAESLRQSN